MNIIKGINMKIAVAGIGYVGMPNLSPTYFLFAHHEALGGDFPCSQHVIRPAPTKKMPAPYPEVYY